MYEYMGAMGTRVYEYDNNNNICIRVAQSYFEVMIM